MDVEYRGANSVVINTKKATLVTDPKLSLVGLKDPSTKNQIVLTTEDRFALENDDALIHISGPGEYEIADITVKGIAAQRHIDTEAQPYGATIYRIETGGVRIALLGNIAPVLEEGQLEAIGIVDILIIPVGGGGYTLDATSASHLAREIDAKVIIPVHYADSAIKYEVHQDTLENFTKEFGATAEQHSKYKLKNEASLPSAVTIVELTRN